MQSIGDMANALVQKSQQFRLKQQMMQLSSEMTTGLVSDPAKHLSGNLSGLAAIDRTLERLDGYRNVSAEVSLLATTMQSVLEKVQGITERATSELLFSELTPTADLRARLSDESEAALSAMIGKLNSSVTGRFAFSGTATDRPPLADAETLKAELRLAVAGETTLSGIEARLDAFFDDPGGTFETVIYQGSTQPLAPMEIGENESVNLDIRADDPLFRSQMKALAMGTLAGDPALALPFATQGEMHTRAAELLSNAQKPMVEVRAGLGALEARIEETSTRNAAERTASSLARLDLVKADEFETAVRFENVRTQLESLYAITARSSRLSLTEYLR